MANQSVLAIVQGFCREYGLPVVTALQGSSDAGALQMRELLTSVGEEIWDTANWQICSRRPTWVSVLGTDQGDIDILFPEDYAGIISRTFWDMTQRLPFYGPVNDANWQYQRALVNSGPYYQFKIEGNRLYVTSSMPAGHTLSVYYKSRRWVNRSGTFATTFANDTDSSVFPDKLMKLGLRAFWLRLKQMPHAWEMQKFEDAVLSEASGNTVQPILSMSGDSGFAGSGISIPLWNTVP